MDEMTLRDLIDSPEFENMRAEFARLAKQYEDDDRIYIHLKAMADIMPRLVVAADMIEPVEPEPEPAPLPSEE